MGIDNELVAETGYDSLAAFEAGQQAMYADPAMVEQATRVNDVAVEGKGFSELLERATTAG